MKVLKILSVSFTVFLLSTNSIFAQSQAAKLTDEQKEKMEQNIKEFHEVLSLSEEQKPDFEEITKKYANQMIAVRDGGGGKLSKYKKVKAIRKNKNSEMEKLLSKDQYKIYLERQEEMQKKMKENRN